MYLAFATKAGLLRAVWDLALKGDERPDAIAARPWYAAVLAEPDGDAQAPAARARVGEGEAAHRRDPPGDPQRRPTSTTISRRSGTSSRRDFWTNQRVVVESLHATRSLRRGLDVDRGADILWTLNHPDQWQLLVVQRGWTPAEFERWLADRRASTCWHRSRVRSRGDSSPARDQPSGRTTSAARRFGASRQ